MRAVFFRRDTGIIAQRADGSQDGLAVAAEFAGFALLEIDPATYDADPPVEQTHRVADGALVALADG